MLTSVDGIYAAGQSAKWSRVPGFWSTIGEADLKYQAWGDGFTVWYETAGVAVGVLTYNADADADADYDLGERLIAERKAAPVPLKQ
ncbi:hypothetical protein [Mycolicibacterium komossense]|uniref:hypothetical protein n=1 Tax=Mycolicibacterium komossense TaxID=1779 RepID=UPI0021F2F53C|nr:hypothetical protein [Mycolicibacterium komossense]